MTTLESRVRKRKDAHDTLTAKDVFSKFRDDLKPIIAAYANGETIREAPFIADDMGFKLESVLKVQDLMALSDGQDLSGISRGDLRSFHRADLIMRVADQRGDESYISVEASYTVDERDISRAIRNARIPGKIHGEAR